MKVAIVPHPTGEWHQTVMLMGTPLVIPGADYVDFTPLAEWAWKIRN